MATIDYKEKYEKAVQAAMLAKQDTESAVTIGILEEIFPELKESKESKDEKIIERIKKAVTYYWSDELLHEILVWLEKQGEKTSDKIVEKARTEKQRVLLTETDGSANIDWDCRSLDDVKTLLKCGLEFIRTIEANKQILPDSRFGGCSFRVPTRYDKGIKQGEQKPNDKIQLGKKYKCIASPRYSAFMKGEIYKPEDKFLCSLMNLCSDCFEPIVDGEQKSNPCDGCVNRKGCINCENGNMKETEQKSVDKIEPKFHEGEWVVNNKNRIGVVTKILKEHYTISFDGREEQVSFAWESKFRKWDISDAKDGDVLADRDIAILLFRGVGNNEWSDVIDYYALLETNMNNRFSLQEGDAYWGKVDNCSLCPATKEQRDLLFQKMKEAGYEWDSDKKELRKIDWNPQPGDTFRKKGTESPIYYLCDKREDGIHFEFVEERENGAAGGEISIFSLKNEYELVERLKPIEMVIEEEFNKITELKPSWSEEDEKMYTATIFALAGFMRNKDKLDWLKSLKDRYTWKPSDEQMDALYTYIYNPQYFSSSDPRMELVESVYQDLKKLKK